jgi:lysophospholipase L1-like esterase
MTNRACSAGARGSRRSLRSALWSVLLSCAASAFAATGDGGLADPNITFVGRWDKSSSTQYTSHWDGAYLTTRFTGRNVTVELASPMTFKAVIDGTISTYWTWGNTTVRLDTSALTNDGPHRLQIVADYDDREIPFNKLVLDPGATTLPVEPRPWVEFVGDSITAGQGAEHGALGDYASRTGEALGAHHTQIAWAGITLTDGVHYSNNNWPGMESMYFRAWAVNRCSNPDCTPDAANPVPNPAWDFSQYSPKIIVVNLGTNDWNLNEPGSTFQGEYTGFLQNIRAKHPNAEIFVLRTFNGYLVQETQNAVAARINAGDTKLHYVDTTGWLIPSPSPDFADTFHPNDTGYQKVRDRLVPILLPYLGGVTTVNDTQFNYDSTANWPSGWQSGAWQNDNHWSNLTNASYEVPFNGTQVHLYGARAPWHGIAAVSVDGGPETSVDTYGATRTDGAWLWSSPVLALGTHTLKVRVTGLKNPSASGTYVAADRVDIVNRDVNLLSNAGFENGLSGWSVVSSGASQSSVSTASPRSGTSSLVHWSGVPYWVATYQTVGGLSNGLYTVKAWMRGSAGHQLYIKNYGGDTKFATLAGSSAHTEVVISDVNVTNGSAEIGFWTNDTAGKGWLYVDDVTFYKQ